ncbi:HNH endonuclease signature motif containing protein [uncultured Clostridium sp.]|nr:HNH endonuclease signature motif containing protein [uncultured Clostridium sp.]
MENPIINASTEYNDNRISLYTAQKGVCAVSKEKLSIGNMEVHHKLPRKQGGNDEYANLMLITRDIHKLIHATKDKTILEYLDKIKPTKEMLDKINKLRSMLINRKPITI